MVLRHSGMSQSGGKDLTRILSLTHIKAPKFVTSYVIVIDKLQQIQAYPHIDSNFPYTYAGTLCSMGEKAEASDQAGGHTWPSSRRSIPWECAVHVSLEPMSRAGKYKIHWFRPSCNCLVTNKGPMAIQESFSGWTVQWMVFGQCSDPFEKTKTGSLIHKLHRNQFQMSYRSIL